MDSLESKKTDILVIGGGPAGTTFGSFMRMRNRHVTLLEKDHHPRFHIGESLLPMNVPILDRLGVLEKVREIGVPKLGADFTVGNAAEPHKTFHFSQALGNSPDSAFEVRRSEFDQLLFDNAREKGVDAHEGMCVTNVERLENGDFKVEARDGKGQTHTWQARFLLDASGRDTFLASKNGWKRRNSKHASAAVFSHFSAVTRRPGDDSGNISIYWFDHGWIWMIPLRDDVMSIGAVCMPSHLKNRKGDLDEFLIKTLKGVDEIRHRMSDAKLLMPAKATGNYSYLSNRMHGQGFMMVGDAFAFIDPVFSSGVYIAMDSAERAANVADAWLSGDRKAYQKALRRYKKDTQRALSTFSWFIYRFTSPAMAFLMSNPKNVLRVVQAVISMLAGDVYANSEIKRRLSVFKTIYYVSWVLRWRESLTFRKTRLADLKAENQA